MSIKFNPSTYADFGAIMTAVGNSAVLASSFQDPLAGPRFVAYGYDVTRGVVISLGLTGPTDPTPPTFATDFPQAVFLNGDPAITLG